MRDYSKTDTNKHIVNKYTNKKQHNHVNVNYMHTLTVDYFVGTDYLKMHESILHGENLQFNFNPLTISKLAWNSAHSLICRPHPLPVSLITMQLPLLNM